MTNYDPREPRLIVTDSLGFCAQWEGFTDEQVINKLVGARDIARKLGIVADITLHIKAPQPLSTTQRALILCELWFDCDGRPTEEQWNLVLNDMWEASCHAARERGEPRPEKPPFPPRPLFALSRDTRSLRAVTDDRFYDEGPDMTEEGDK